MKHLFVLLALGGVFSSSISAQTLTFTRTYGGPAGYDDARSIVTTADGGFAFTGLCQSGPDLAGDLYLTKVNAAGATLWTRYYGRDEEDGGNHLLATTDGGFLITGHTALSYGVNCDGYVVKTDADGALQWYALIGTAFDDVCNAAVELEDGSFLLTGRTEHPVNHDFHVLLAKISAEGQVLFTRALPAENAEIAYAMTRTADGNLLLAGYATLDAPRHDMMLLLQCDLEGRVIWRKRWRNSKLPERAQGLTALPDGGCVVVGGTHDAAVQPVDMMVVRFDAAGRQTGFGRIFGDLGKGHLAAVQQKSDGPLVISGSFQETGQPQMRPFVAWLGQDLSVLDWRPVTLPADAHTRCLVQTASGDLVLGGQVGADEKSSDIFLAKFPAPAGTSAVQDVATTSFLLFPNPLRDVAYLKVGTPEGRKNLSLFAPDGRFVAGWAFEGDEYFIRREGLQTGVYFYKVCDEQGALLAAGQLAVE